MLEQIDSKNEYTGGYPSFSIDCERDQFSGMFSL
jgi:hypothetical protein